MTTKRCLTHQHELSFKSCCDYILEETVQLTIKCKIEIGLFVALFFLHKLRDLNVKNVFNLIDHILLKLYPNTDCFIPKCTWDVILWKVIIQAYGNKLCSFDVAPWEDRQLHYWLGFPMNATESLFHGCVFHYKTVVLEWFKQNFPFHKLNIWFH